MKPELMHMHSTIEQCKDAVTKVSDTEWEEEWRPLAAILLKQAEETLSDAKEFTTTVKTLLLAEQAEKLRSLRSTGEKLVGTAQRGIWQHKAGRNTEEVSYDELVALAQKSLLKGKGEYASKVDTLAKDIEQEC